MRKAVFVVFSLVGLAAGAVAALNEGIALQILFGSIGAVVGVAIGGAIAGIGRPGRRSARPIDAIDGLADWSAEANQNHWLDRGRLTAAPGLPHPDDIDPNSQEP